MSKKMLRDALYNEWYKGLPMPSQIIYKNIHYYKTESSDLNYMYADENGNTISFTNLYNSYYHIKYDYIECIYDILDEKEKEYLKGIIKPFRDKVINIAKDTYFGNEYISILYNDTNNTRGVIKLPSFTPNDMYKGMIVDKEYTLKELNL